MIKHRVVINRPGLLITESDYIEDTPQQKYERNYERIFGKKKDTKEEIEKGKE
jgi:hypothetical protein